MGRSAAYTLIAMKKSHNINYKGLLIWFICAVFFTYEFLLRTLLGSYQEPFSNELHLSALKFAFISSTAYQFIYTIMQIPVASITERYGLKRTLLSAALICSLSVILFSFTKQFYAAFFLRLSIGFGASFGFICLLVAVSEWLPKNKKGFFIGLSQFVGTMGPLFAAGPITSLSDSYQLSWRNIHLFLGFIGIFISLLIAIFVKSKTNNLEKFVLLKPKGNLLQSIFSLIRNRQVLFIALYSATVYFSIEYLSENTAKQYLHFSGISQIKASYLLTIAWFFYALGCPALGLISDIKKNRKSIMVFSAICNVIALLLIRFTPYNFLSDYFAFMLLGIGASGQSIGFTIITEQSKPEHNIIALGINNASIGLITAINAPLFGWILSCISQDSPNLLNYNKIIDMLITIALIAVYIVMVKIKETYGKSQCNFTVLNIIKE